MRTMRVVAAALVLLLLVAGHGPVSRGYAPIVSAAPQLADLKGVDELRTLFNKDVGKVRLVLLLSPT